MSVYNPRRTSGLSRRSRGWSRARRSTTKRSSSIRGGLRGPPRWLARRFTAAPDDCTFRAPPLPSPARTAAPFLPFTGSERWPFWIQEGTSWVCAAPDAWRVRKYCSVCFCGVLYYFSLYSSQSLTNAGVDVLSLYEWIYQSWFTFLVTLVFLPTLPV